MGARKTVWLGVHRIVVMARCSHRAACSTNLGFSACDAAQPSSGAHRAYVLADAGPAAHLVARSAVETEPARRPRQAAAPAWRRCFPSAPNDTFNACKRDASAPNPDPAERAGCRS